MPERSERVVLGLCVAVALAHAAFYLAFALTRLSHPFELEWMEGGSLQHVMRVLDGELLYPAPSLEFVPFPYPPLHPYLGALAAKLFGPDLPALRVVSLLSSLGAAALVFRFVQRETGSALWGVACSGLFLGTWRASGLYLDVARLDSLFTLLLLAGLYGLRFARGRGGLLLASLLAGACVMTKQTGGAVFAPLALWCVWADWRAHGGELRTWRDWDRSLAFALPLLVGLLVATALLEHFEGHFLRYVMAVQPGHAIQWSMIGWFFWWDLLVTLPVVSGLLGVWLGLLLPRGESRSRAEQRDAAFFAVALAGVLLACLVPRIKVGGAANNLVPVHAWLAAMFGVAAARVRAFFLRTRPGQGRRVAVGLAAGALLQLLVLVRLPHGYLPTEADRRAGRALAARVAAFEGEVLMPVQGHVAGRAGKRVFAHQMPVADYLNSGLDDAPALLESYARAIRTQRFAAIIDSNTAFLRRALPGGLLERHYRLEGWLFEDPSVLLPISGAQIRAGTLWLPKAQETQRQREAR